MKTEDIIKMLLKPLIILEGAGMQIIENGKAKFAYINPPAINYAAAARLKELKEVKEKPDFVKCKECKHKHDPARCSLWYAHFDGNDYFIEHGGDFSCSWGEREVTGNAES